MKIGEYYKIPWGIRIKEVEDLKPGMGEFIVAVKASGICSSDVKMIKRGHPFLDLYGLPFIGGHEFSGEVTELGHGNKFFHEGDSVVVSWLNPCLECFYCKKGLCQFCLEAKNSLIQPAGFSEMVKIPSLNQRTRVYKFSNKINYEQAAMTEPLACALNGMNIAGLKIGDKVAILGMGFMGLLHLQLAKIGGASQVIVVDSIESRLNLAIELGATDTINFKNDDVTEKVKNLTGGYGADIVIEAVGHIEAYKQAVQLGRKGSTVLFFGGLPSGQSLDIDPNIIHYNQISLKGSYSYTPQTFQKALELIQGGIVNVSKLITHHYSLDNLKDAIIKTSETDSLKVMINSF